jgi:hypothetical protein
MFQPMAEAIHRKAEEIESIGTHAHLEGGTL